MFAKAVGMAKVGDQIDINADNVIGKRCLLDVIVEDYTSKDGRPRQRNKVGRYHKPESASAPVTDEVPEDDVPF